MQSLVRQNSDNTGSLLSRCQSVAMRSRNPRWFDNEGSCGDGLPRRSLCARDSWGSQLISPCMYTSGVDCGYAIVPKCKPGICRVEFVSKRLRFLGASQIVWQWQLDARTLQSQRAPLHIKESTPCALELTDSRRAMLFVHDCSKSLINTVIVVPNPLASCCTTRIDGVRRPRSRRLI